MKKRHPWHPALITSIPLSCLSDGNLVGLQQRDRRDSRHRSNLDRVYSDHPNVTCLPSADCDVVYGSDPAHFAAYGHISPVTLGCDVENGWDLCVVTDGGPTTASPAATTTVQYLNHLPCVDRRRCVEPFGSMDYHLPTFGPQPPCNDPQKVK